jgi:hypothetical protein
VTRAAERLLKLLKTVGYPDNELPKTLKILRTRAGRHQRSAAAWSWFAVEPESFREIVGSQWTVGELCASPARVVLYVDQRTLEHELILEKQPVRAIMTPCQTPDSSSSASPAPSSQ